MDFAVDLDVLPDGVLVIRVDAALQRDRQFIQSQIEAVELVIPFLSCGEARQHEPVDQYVFAVFHSLPAERVVTRNIVLMDAVGVGIAACILGGQLGEGARPIIPRVQFSGDSDIALFNIRPHSVLGVRVDAALQRDRQFTRTFLVLVVLIVPHLSSGEAGLLQGVDQRQPMRIRIFRRAATRLAFERVVLQQHIINCRFIARTSALHKAVFVGQLLSILPIHGGQVGEGRLPSSCCGDRLRSTDAFPSAILLAPAQLQGDFTHLREVRVFLILPVLRDLDRVALDLVGQYLAIFVPAVHVALHAVDGTVLDGSRDAIDIAVLRQAADGHGQTVGLVGFKGARIENVPVLPIDAALHLNIELFRAQAEGIIVVVPLLGEGQAGGFQLIGDKRAALAVAADSDRRRRCQREVDRPGGFHHAELVRIAACIRLEDVLPARRPVVVFRQGQLAALVFAVRLRADLPGSPGVVICAGQLALKLHRDVALGLIQIGLLAVDSPRLGDADLHRIQLIRERLAVAVRIVLAGGCAFRLLIVRNLGFIFHHAVLVGHVSAILPGPGGQVAVGDRPGIGGFVVHGRDTGNRLPVHTAIGGVLERQRQRVARPHARVVVVVPGLRHDQLGGLGGIGHGDGGVGVGRVAGCDRQIVAGLRIHRDVVIGVAVFVVLRQIIDRGRPVVFSERQPFPTGHNRPALVICIRRCIRCKGPVVQIVGDAPGILKAEFCAPAFSIVPVLDYRDAGRFQCVGQDARVHRIHGPGISLDLIIHGKVGVLCAGLVILRQIAEGITQVVAVFERHLAVCVAIIIRNRLPAINAVHIAPQAEGHVSRADIELVVLVHPILPHGELRPIQLILERNAVFVLRILNIAEPVFARHDLLRLIVEQSLLNHAIVQQLARAIVGRQAGELARPAGALQIDGIGGRALVQRCPAVFNCRRSGILQGEAQLVRAGAVMIVKIILPILAHADLQGFERIRELRFELHGCRFVLPVIAEIRVTNNIIGIGFLYTIVQLLIVLIVPRQVRPGMGLGGYFGILVQRYRSAQIVPNRQFGLIPAAVLQLQRDALRAGDGCKV